MSTTTALSATAPALVIPHSRIRQIAGAAAVIAVLGRVASTFLWPPDSDASHARMLAAAAAHPSAGRTAEA